MVQKKVDKKTRSAAVEKVTGTVVLKPLDSVKPNPWNDNEMTPQMMESLRHGLRTEGWIASHALLVWGTDEHGRKKNIIIDGEQVYMAAIAEGFKKGPMVFLGGVSEHQAKALTIKMNKKRGKPNEDKLSALLRELQESPIGDTMTLELGFSDEELAKLLAEMPTEMPPGVGGSGAAESAHSQSLDVRDASDVDTSNYTRLVQLFFSPEEQEEWTKLMKACATKLGTANVTATTLVAVREYAKQAGLAV